MLVLSRLPSEWIDITIPPSSEPQHISLTVTKVQNPSRVSLGFQADKTIVINRREIQAQIDKGEKPLSKAR